METENDCTKRLLFIRANTEKGTTMAEYIKREDAINLLHYHADEACSAVVADFESIPAADVAPVVHGRWKYYHKQNIAVCTNCSFERDLDANFGKAVSCPNCSAKMDGKGNE